MAASPGELMSIGEDCAETIKHLPVSEQVVVAVSMAVAVIRRIEPSAREQVAQSVSTCIVANVMGNAL